MKYLIYENENDAKERNHEAWLDGTPQPAGVERSTWYRWHTKIHPDTGEAALCIPDDEVVLLDANEILDLDDALDASWEVSE